MLLDIGTGLGAGIVIDHKLLRGSRWTAGEIGYMFVPAFPIAPLNAANPAPWRAWSVEKAYASSGNNWGIQQTHHSPATQIFEAASTSDTLAKTILEQTARLLSHTICNL